VALQFAKDIKFDFSPHVGWDGSKSDPDNIRILSQTRHSPLVPEEFLVTASCLNVSIQTPVVSLREVGSL
jgi:hypothetical protein